MVEFAEFKQKIDDNNLSSIILFEGEEVYLSESGLNALKDKFVEFPDLNYVKIDDLSDMQVLLSHLDAFPFMSTKRLVTVSEFYPTASVLKGALFDFFENPPETTLFVIINKKSCDALKKQKTVTTVSCSKQSPAILVKWTVREFAKLGKTIANDVALKICEYSLMDMTKINNEVQKLASYTLGDDKITLADVDKVVIKESDYRIYEMTDFVAKRDFDKAFTVLTEMLNGGEPPQKLLVSLYYHYRKLFHVAVSPLNDNELAKALGVKEVAIAKMRRQVKTFNLKNLKNAVDVLADYDFKFKSGEVNVDTAFLLSVFKIMVG